MSAMVNTAMASAVMSAVRWKGAIRGAMRPLSALAGNVLSFMIASFVSRGMHVPCTGAA